MEDKMAEDNVWKNLGDNIVGAAPALGALLAPATGGVSAMIGTGVGILGRIFGLGDKPDPDTLKNAIATDPQAALKLSLADKEWQLEMYRAETDRLTVEIDNIKSARSRQTESEKATGKRDYNLYAFAWLNTLGFYAVVGFFVYMLKACIAIQIPQALNDVLFLLIGCLTTNYTNVNGYFFGSSSGSDLKTQLLSVIKRDSGK